MIIIIIIIIYNYDEYMRMYLFCMKTIIFTVHFGVLALQELPWTKCIFAAIGLVQNIWCFEVQ